MRLYLKETKMPRLASESQMCLLPCLPPERWDPGPVAAAVVSIIILRLDSEGAQAGLRLTVWLRMTLHFDLPSSLSPGLASPSWPPC